MERRGMRFSLYCLCVVIPLVVLATGLPGVSADGSVAVSVRPSSESVGIDNTTAFDVVVESVDSGVGSYTVGISVDSDIASITEVSPLKDPGMEDVSISSDGSSADVTAALMDTKDEGDVKIISFKVKGESEGTTEVSVNPEVISGEVGNEYTVSEVNDGSLTVTPPNEDPTADAGGPYSVDEGEAVDLDGMGSSDPEENIVGYSWTLDGVGSLENAETAAPAYVAPDEVPTDTEVTVELTVEDGAGNTDTDTATVTVNDLEKEETESWAIDLTASEGAGTITIGMASSHSETEWFPAFPPAWYIDNNEKNYTRFIVGFTDEYTWNTFLNVVDPHDFTFDWDDLDTADVPEYYTVKMQVKDETINLRGRESYGPITIENNTVIPITAEKNRPPTPYFTYSPSPPTTQDSVEFTDNSTDSDGTIASWSWDFGDGSTSTAENPTHSYADDGTYTVTLTVTDDDGSADTHAENITVANVAPSVDAGGPYDVDEGSTVELTAAASDPDGTVENYSWSITGGSIGRLENPHTATATYVAPSELSTETEVRVAVTVADDDGATGSDNTTITTTPVSGQPAWELNLTAFGNGIESGIRIGMADDPDAESPAPSPPTPMVQWVVENGANSYRKLVVEHENSYTWNTSLRVDPADNVTFQWESLVSVGFPENFDLIMELGGETVSLEGSTSYGPVSLSEGSHDISIRMCKKPSRERENVSLTQGWILFSLPLRPVNPGAENLFSKLSEFPTIYGWDQGYVPVDRDDELEIGQAYWVYSAESENITIVGTSVENLTLELSAGWNLAGLPSGVLPRTPASVFDQVPTIYGWGKGYRSIGPSNNFEPGKGYWVYSETAEDVPIP